ncbi:MAG TPA: DUF5615 family PIN-like protein [Blastocatellia bacterium]|nr:DUF5615 family PIN-like protein [Blastocatellia bacterium]
MTVRFQADADLKQVIVKAIQRREPAIDFQTATQAGLAQLPDQEVLARAAGEGRVLVTHDRKTMPAHFSEFVARSISAGVIVVPQDMPVAGAVEDLILIWSASRSEEWLNRICFLPL